MGGKGSIAGGVAALAVGMATIAAWPPTVAMAAEVKTLKEQLSDKASDEQRVDNCGVPPERRGPVPRPGCPVDDAASVPAAGQDQPAPPPQHR